jgi:hypothetical protein
MNLHLNWLKPASLPSCDYKVAYRRMGEVSYTEFDTSGNTSGITSGTTDITVSAPASYEGFVKSNCCDSNLSVADTWGVNGYGTVGISIAMSAAPLNYIATITSTYANPYETVLTGTFVSDLAGTVSYTVNYPADSTTATVTLANTAISANESISSVGISTISPIYANGGQLQQLDPVRTPAYFEFYASSGATSGATGTYGNPLTLPSFTLAQFNVTEIDVSSNPIAGQLLVSWIQDGVYEDGVIPYNTITFTIEENAVPGTVLGTLVVAATPNGARDATIYMVKGSSPLAVTTLYKMQVYWTDDSQPPVHPSRTFYLPDF